MSTSKLFRMIVGNVPIGREKDYYDYVLIPELEAFNRVDTVNMNNNEMNKFRHVAGSKQALNDLGYLRGTGALLYKELQDNKKHLDWQDTKEDLLNDARALKLHFTQPNLEGEKLYNHVFNNYIQLYRK